MKIAAIVPSLNPSQEFLDVIDGLVQAGFPRIYAVDDGSGEGYRSYFDHAAAYPQCVVLRHEVNLGKGRGLKTAFQRYLEDDEGLLGVVTLDGDGQHSTEDVVRVAETLTAHPDTLVLGARDFSQDHVPAKSALGNRITRSIFRHACGIPITDTQTGLRGIPNSFIPTLLDVKGDRYEYETNMLLATKRAGVPVMEIPISTIYLNDNAASHYRPFRDSLRIYLPIIKFSFARFLVSSLLSTLLDLALFTLLNYLLASFGGAHRLLIATVVARVVSALFNFAVNRRFVFASKTDTAGSLGRYTILALAQMLCSYGGVYLFSEVLPLPALPAKIIVDVTLFFISFFVQRRWVFRTAG